jgi:hypothetical protein
MPRHRAPSLTVLAGALFACSALPCAAQIGGKPVNPVNPINPGGGTVTPGGGVIIKPGFPTTGPTTGGTTTGGKTGTTTGGKVGGFITKGKTTGTPSGATIGSNPFLGVRSTLGTTGSGSPNSPYYIANGHLYGGMFGQPGGVSTGAYGQINLTGNWWNTAAGSNLFNGTFFQPANPWANNPWVYAPLSSNPFLNPNAGIASNPIAFNPYAFSPYGFNPYAFNPYGFNPFLNNPTNPMMMPGPISPVMWNPMSSPFANPWATPFSNPFANPWGNPFGNPFGGFPGVFMN